MNSDHEELIELDLSVAAGVCSLDHRLNIGERDLDFEQLGEEQVQLCGSQVPVLVNIKLVKALAQLLEDQKKKKSKRENSSKRNCRKITNVNEERNPVFSKE